MKPLAILVVDDEAVQRETLASILKDQAYQVVTAGDVSSAVGLISKTEFDVVVSDFKMPGGSGLDIAAHTAHNCAETSVFIMTAYADVNSVIDAMRLGVVDYLLKPLNVDAFLRRIAVIQERRNLRLEVNFLRREIARAAEGASLLGNSPAIDQVRKIIDQVSNSKGTVLITGESGTGKEVVARSIHAASSQNDKHFVAVNCGALPENLLESELFGHKKGAFTGAVANKQGLFVAAGDGTIFLDEIGEMPKNLQVKLLRVLQEREVTPIGETAPIKVHARIVTATNRELTIEVAENRFRQDLYYRINVVEIKMPSLRERPEDIPTLAQHFVEKFTRELGKPNRPISAEAMRKLMLYPWPGNVRELENVIERTLILSSQNERIDTSDLPMIVQTSSGSGEDNPAGLLRLDEAVKLFTRHHIQRALRLCDGDKKEAAKTLGVGLSSLYRKIDECMDESPLTSVGGIPPDAGKESVGEGECEGTKRK